jgi:predicted transcriptional regulator
VTKDLISRTVRLSPKQDRQLRRLSEKLNLDNANVIRLALTRLAEAEGIK